MTQSEEVADELILYYAHVCTLPYFDENIWRDFGFSRRPKRGTLVQKIVPKKFVYENIIRKTLFCMSLTDIVASIKQSSHSSTVKHMVIIGVLDKLLSTANIFDENFVDDFIVFCEKYLQYKDENIQASLIKDVQGQLSEKSLANYTIGILKIIPSSNPSSLILDIPTMVRRINDANLENARVGLDMGVDYYEKYHRKLLQLLN